MTEAEMRAAAWAATEGPGADLARDLEPVVIIAEVACANDFRMTILRPVCMGVIYRSQLGQPLTGAIDVSAMDCGWGPWAEDAPFLRGPADRESWRAMAARLKAAVEALDESMGPQVDWN